MDFEQSSEWVQALQALEDVFELTVGFTDGEAQLLGRELRQTVLELVATIAQEAESGTLSEAGKNLAVKQLARLLAVLTVAVKLSTGSREAVGEVQAKLREFVVQLEAVTPSQS